MGRLDEVKPVLTRIFGEHYNLAFCCDMTEAIAGLERGVWTRSDVVSVSMAVKPLNCCA
jgi:hypothetical protein